MLDGRHEVPRHVAGDHVQAVDAEEEADQQSEEGSGLPPNLGGCEVPHRPHEPNPGESVEWDMLLGM